MSAHPLSEIARWRVKAGPLGLPSVCSAHPMVLEAAMRATLPTDLPLLIEATCNQVNQDGGYTGMTPADFRARVENIARAAGFPIERVILGGDHLGPNPWKSLPAAEAMDKADAMVRAYAAAGFTKLHLDCSMGCAGEPVALDNARTARRAARLAAAAEEALPGGDMPAPVYVIGTEVPIPGGAMEKLGALEVTTAAAATETVSAHRVVFEEAGLDDAFARVVGLVVQPGVEFGNHNVIDYDPAAARELSAALDDLPGLVFEAHSTDYQIRESLAALVSDGFAILKVGPGLTFALREALYGLDSIATELVPEGRDRTLRQVMEMVMLADPSHWEKYYDGDAEARRRLRHFSYSDRIRYYWPNVEAEAAVAQLFDLLEDWDIPEPLIGQYLGHLFPTVRSGEVPCHARPLVLASIELVMQDYIAASFGLHRETGSLRRG
ncbi:D-tagatose-bisphosphate aldolase, class II, non-catalytic subunit [Chelativorans xinjiangense]|uniref:D-tagatose-bisphosphate aldolase, class II, non-catalytic subunit n=1 Tax=Chelativorans xinjiangense TaxID=2681485 RepID=UPI00135A6AE1|nr:D-tagatose-bisphosphate aldolase, class II, non-catalytic subunit [Chelativorans xinjiangense]